jgi:hypothetical protein
MMGQDMYRSVFTMEDTLQTSFMYAPVLQSLRPEVLARPNHVGQLVPFAPEGIGVFGHLPVNELIHLSLTKR